MVLDYYAYWNGGQIRDLFEALVAITSGPSYAGLLKSAVLAGFLCTITGALLKWQGFASKVYLFAALLFYSVMFVPKVDISIHDERSSDVYVVSNVPLGVGFFASASSRIGHFLTESFETAFSLPDAERFSKFGLVYPQRALNALLSAGPVTPEGRHLTERIVSDCIGPELIDHPAKAAELSTAGDLWAVISESGWLNPARSTLASDGSVQTCEEALAALDNHLNSVEVDFIAKRLGAVLSPERTDPAEVIRRTLPHSEALLLGVSRSLESGLKHSVMLSSLPRGLASIAEQSGAPLDIAVKYASSQANLASEINYRTLARLAEHSLPKIRNCVEFIVIAAFPFMLLLMIAAGSAAGTVFRSFFVLLIWFQLWAPLFAVANYLMITVDAQPMNRIAAEFGGATIMAASLIRETGATSQAIAGSLMLLIPVIAFALAKGSDMAFVSMASGLMAPAQSAAGSSASQAASGNFNAGNVSMGNVSSNSTSANKSDTSASWSDPYASKTQTAYGSVTRDGSATVTGMDRTSINLGITSSGSIAQSRSAGAASSETSSLSQSESQALSLSSSATSGETVSREFARAMSEGLSRRQGLAQSSSSQQSASVSQSASDASSVSRGLATSESFTFSSGGNLKFGAGQAMLGSQPGASPTSSSENNPATGPALPQSGSVSSSLPGGLPSVNPSVMGLAQNTKGGQTPTGSPANSSAPPNGQSSRSVLTAVAEGAGLGIGAETKTAQQLVDTASGIQTAATQRQKAVAYHALRSTSEEIASSAGDESMRRAAQNFTAALDKAYRRSSDQSRTADRSLSSSRTVSENLSGTDQTSVNHDVLVMNRLLSSGNHSAESHLQSLFESSAKREQLGAVAAADSYVRASGGQNLGAGQIRNAPLNSSSVEQKSVSELNAVRRNGDRLIGKKGSQFKAELENSSRTLSSPLDFDRASFDKRLQLEDELNSIQLNRASENAELRNEKLRDATLGYQKQEQGVGNVMGIALAGGLNYKSPLAPEDDIHLTDKSKLRPDF